MFPSIRCANHCSPGTYSIRQHRKSVGLVDVPDCRRDSHSPQASIKQGQTSQLMKSEALQETAGFQTTFRFLIKTSNCNRVAVHTYAPDFSLKEDEQNFHSPRQQKPVFPFLTSSLLIDSELDVPRLHCTIMFEITSAETSTTLLQKAVGCNR